MGYGSTTNLGKLSHGDKPIKIGSDTLQPTDQVRDLGVYFDSELNMKAHIKRVASACYYHLRRLRALRGLLGQAVTARLVSAFILSRLDYCNAVLAGLPASIQAPLQRVLHAAVRVVCDLKPCDNISESIRALHWLHIKQRIDFKICLLVHHTVNGRAPSYLQDLISPSFPFLVVQHFVPLAIMILSSNPPIASLVIVHFLSLVLVRGTLYQQNLKLSRTHHCLNVNLRHCYL